MVKLGERQDKHKPLMASGFRIVASILLAASLIGVFNLTSAFSIASAQNLTTAGEPQMSPVQLGKNQTSEGSQLPGALQQLQEAAKEHAKQQAAMNITEDERQKAKEVANAVDGVLIYYAKALGDTNVERINVTDPNAMLSSVRIPQVPLNEEQIAGGSNNIVSAADYLVAQGFAIKAIESYSDVSASAAATADPVTLQQLADTQEGLSLLLGMIKNKLPYNLVEDVVSSPIKNNLEHIFSASTAEIS